MMKRALISFLLVVGVGASVCQAAGFQTPEDISFTAALDGTTQKYVRLLPVGFDVSASHDLVIALHGHGSDRWQFATSTRDECRAARDIAAANNMIYISPDYRATTSWMGPAAEADVVQILQDVKQQYNVDKVFFIGGSMGGTSVLTFAALHPELVDGVTSLNGLADHMTFNNFQTEIAASFGGTKTEVPQEYIKRSSINYPGSFAMPLAITAGGADTVVPAQSVLQLSSTVQNTNPKVLEFYRPTGGHSTNYSETAISFEYVIRNAHGIDTDLNPITINGSFESQGVAAGSYVLNTVDGWTSAGSGLVGVVNPTDAVYAAEYDDPRPDGGSFAIARNAALFQYTGTQVQEGTYKLTLKAGSQKSNVSVATLLCGFLVADTNVADVADLVWGADDAYFSPQLAAGKLTQIDFEWVVEAGDAAIGKELYIDLWANSSQWVHFDEVSMSFTPVPEPMTMTLLLCGLPVICRKKRRS